jgi:hypothetical protein
LKPNERDWPDAWQSYQKKELAKVPWT